MTNTENTQATEIETLRQDKAHLYVVGDGASMHIGGDAYPYTIRKVSASGHMVWASQDEFRVTPGANEYARAHKVGTFIPVDMPETQWTRFTRRANGRYYQVGCKGYSVLFPGREFCQDPSF